MYLLSWYASAHHNIFLLQESDVRRVRSIEPKRFARDRSDYGDDQRGGRKGFEAVSVRQHFEGDRIGHGSVLVRRMEEE